MLVDLAIWDTWLLRRATSRRVVLLDLVLLSIAIASLLFLLDIYSTGRGVVRQSAIDQVWQARGRIVGSCEIDRVLKATDSAVRTTVLMSVHIMKDCVLHGTAYSCLGETLSHPVSMTGPLRLLEQDNQWLKLVKEHSLNLTLRCWLT